MPAGGWWGKWIVPWSLEIATDRPAERRTLNTVTTSNAKTYGAQGGFSESFTILFLTM